MRVSEIETLPSPRTAGWRRLRARIDYASVAPDELWLDVPPQHADALVTTGDPWLAWLAPLAITVGEPLAVDAPVDPLLLAGVREAAKVWTGWYPHLRSVTIDAPMSEGSVPASRRAAFFTGGVDSFFTALAPRAASERIEALIFIWGFDIPLSSDAAWRTALDGNLAAARKLGVPLIPVATNLRETRFRETNWTRLSHGVALAGVAQALGGELGTVLIPSSASQRDLRPWGSHPDVDPLFSSRRTRIIHDGAEWRRAEKTEQIAKSDVALGHLRVCYESADGKNCGLCKRCYRTMLALEALGVLDRCATFDRRTLDLHRAARVYCQDDTDRKQFGFVRDLAVREGRREIVRAIDDSFRRSARMRRVVSFVRGLRDMPVVWRWAPAWERRLLREWVT